VDQLRVGFDRGGGEIVGDSPWLLDGGPRAGSFLGVYLIREMALLFKGEPNM